MPTEEKATCKIVRNFMEFLFTFGPYPPQYSKLQYKGRGPIPVSLTPAETKTQSPAETVCNILAFLWAAQGMVSVSLNSELRQEWWHTLDLKLEAVEGSGGCHCAWKLQRNCRPMHTWGHEIMDRGIQENIQGPEEKHLKAGKRSWDWGSTHTDPDRTHARKRPKDY